MQIPLLIDADLEATKAYGILNEKNGKVPHPAVVLVDQEGTVRFFHVDENFRKRPAVETVLEAVRAIQPSQDS